MVSGVRIAAAWSGCVMGVWRFVSSTLMVRLGHVLGGWSLVCMGIMGRVRTRLMVRSSL